MQEFVKELVEQKLQKQIVLEKPKDKSLGHYATPVAFSLAKEYRKSPMIIAQDIATQLQDIKEFESVDAVKGFVNIVLSGDFLDQKSNEALGCEKEFAKGKKQNKKILLEYVSANPTGPLHIGHARGAVLGDTLAKIGRHLGYDITTEYYINDAGAQMDLLGLSLYLAGRESILQKEVEYPQKYYRGEYLFEIAKLCEKKFGKEVFEDSTHLDKLASFAKEQVMKIIIADLADLGIVFDNFVSEKSLYTHWERTKKLLHTKQKIYTKENKVWLKSTDAKDDADRVVVRENGIPTYLAGDIIYHQNKFERGYTHCINIWGADHHGYIARVKAAVEFLGYDSSHLEILLSQMVALLKDKEPYKMSKRAGNVILMSDITQEIGSDALRFIFLTKKSDTHLEFDLGTLSKQDSTNPIFYIQYAHARINQLFKKSQFDVQDVQLASIRNLHEDAQYLVYESLLLQDILEEAFAKRDCQKVTDYLYFVASLIHKFYNEYKIVGNKNEKEYLKVLALGAMTLKVGLSLLGIHAKKEM